MSRDIKEYVRSCDTCQRHVAPTNLKQGYLHPLPIPEDRFESVGIDFALLTRSRSGMTAVMIIVDRLTKLMSLIPCMETLTAIDCGKLLFKNCFCTGKGLPKSIVSDRDPKFTSDVWK